MRRATDRRPPRPRGGGLSAGGWAPLLTPRTAVRIAILGGIALSLLGLLLVRLWFLQVIGGEQYAAAAESNRLRKIVTEAPRGNILDRNGHPLVANRPGKDVTIRARELSQERLGQVLRRIAPKLGTPVASLRRTIAAVSDEDGTPPLEPVVLARNVDQRVYFYLAQRGRQFPGIAVRNSYLRTYPKGDLAAHILGQVGKISPEELPDYERRGYAGDEAVGKGGIEEEYEQYLKGTPGRDVVEVDAAGEPVGREVVSSRAPAPGRDIQTSIDAPTQRALQDALREQVETSASTGAAGVAMDPVTGEVIAMASYPTFKPSIFVKGDEKAIQRVYRDPGKVSLNRAIDGTYPSGSTFKVVTAAAALGLGWITPGQLVDSPSVLTLYKQDFPNFKNIAHGEVDLPRALEVSSDTYFYRLGDLFYRANGSLLQPVARSFGLGSRTGVDIPGENPGLVPDPEWKKQAFAGAPFTDLDRSWKPGDSIQLSVGQGYFLATPLQMAVVYSAIANGGTVVTPSIGRQVLDPNGRVQRRISEGLRTHRADVSDSAVAAIQQGLFQAANGPDGTATSVFGRLPDADKVAGKTGTAEKADEEDYSWFVGYAPADDPSVVVAIVVERAGTGASAAAPAVCATMAAGLAFDSGLCGENAVAN